MSEMRQTQIMEEEFVGGYTAEEVENDTGGEETIEVKDAPGKVARIRVITGAINVTPMDGTDEAWGVLTNADEFNLAGTPMQFKDSIALKFSDDGVAWILYK